MKVLRSLIKHIALIFAVLIYVYSCQKDDTVSTESQSILQQSSITKTVSASEIPKVMQFLESKSNNRLEFIIDDSNSELGMHRSHEENLSVTTALTDQIKMVTNDYGKSNYTFKLIEEQTKEGVYFLNLVVKEYKDELYMYIVKYVPDTNWLSDYTDETSFSSFTGDLYIYNAEGIYVGRIVMLDGVTSAFAKHPCPGDGDGEENDTDHIDNNPGGAGNSGDGTETSGESSSNSSSTDNGSSTGGGGGENITIICGCGPEHSENQIMTGHCTCDTIIITVGNRSMSEALRHPCPNDEAPEECFDAVGDPCPHGCDADGNCVDDSEEIENSGVGIDIDLGEVLFASFVNTLTEEQQQFLEDNPEIEEEIQQFLEENGFEDEDFAEYAINVLMYDINFNPLLGADCRSFEYAQPPGALQRGCAVTDFNHTFYAFGINSQGNPYWGDISSNIDLIFFTMPTWMTNGQAANLTAEAVTNAIRETDLYFFENPYESEFEVGDFFRNALVSNLALVGGSISTSQEPFPIPSLAPYITSFFGAATDCN